MSKGLRWTEEEYAAARGRAGSGAAPPTSAKPQKYRAVPTEVDGHLFPSKREAGHYQALKLREAAGEIAELRLQFRWPLEVRDVLVTTYVADFTFRDARGELHVQDAKGVRTEAYRLKRKLFEALHHLCIEEV